MRTDVGHQMKYVLGQWIWLYKVPELYLQHFFAMISVEQIACLV